MRRLGGLALGLVLGVAVAAPVLADPPAAPVPAAGVAAAAEPAGDPPDRAPEPSETSPLAVPAADAPVRLADGPQRRESAAGIALDAPAPPGLGISVVRFAGAVAVVGVLLTLTLLVLRALFRTPRPAAPAKIAASLASRLGWRALWGRGPADVDGLEIVERGYVGAKESVCVVRVGAQRFLIGVTPAQISLLGRLGTAGDGDTSMPAAADFARAVAGAAVEDGARSGLAPQRAVARPAPADTAFRALLERSRERLARLESPQRCEPAAGIVLEVEPVRAGGGDA